MLRTHAATKWRRHNHPSSHLPNARTCTHTCSFSQKHTLSLTYTHTQVEALRCLQWRAFPHTATHCDTLQNNATNCNTLDTTARHVQASRCLQWRAFPHAATLCNTMQHHATHWNTSQHTATQLQHTCAFIVGFVMEGIPTYCNTLKKKGKNEKTET